MSIIHQNSVPGHHSVDDAAPRQGSGDERETGRERQAAESGTQGLYSSTVTISFQAELRLRAFQEQRKLQMNPAATDSGSVSNKKIQSQNRTSSFNSIPGITSEAIGKSNDVSSTFLEGQLEEQLEEQRVLEQHKDNSAFSQRINNMLSEVQNNIVQAGDSGYQYLVNVLHNNKETVEDQRQLQEIMRKEQFFLTRRKPFMQNSDFQSYSQVLSQFSNIVERQQYS